MRSALTLLVALTMTLAGCAEGGGGLNDDPDEDSFEDLKLNGGRGAIRGIVLDASITPIEGATISIESLGMEATSNADGAFTFSDLEPGSYFLGITKAGYSPSQTNVQVEADNAAPPIIKVKMARDQSNRPYTQVSQHVGYLQCGAGIPAVDNTAWTGGAINACALVDSINTFDVFVDRPVAAAQSELVWEGTNLFGDGLNIGHFDPNSLSGNYVANDGGSPVILLVNGTTMLNYNGPGYESFMLRVFPGSSSLSVVIEQEFEIINTNFYGFMPDEGWTFLEDGPHPNHR